MQYLIWKLLIVVKTDIVGKGVVALLYSTTLFRKLPIILQWDAYRANIFPSECISQVKAKVLLTDKVSFVEFDFEKIEEI